MRKYYSRLAQIEEKRNLRTAIVLVFLSILLIAGVGVFGIPLLTRIAGVAVDLKGSSSTDNDTTPPPPPIITQVPDFTNQSKITLQGSTETGATLKIYLNDEKQEQIADVNGRFTTDLNLVNGENSLYATATDKNGNTSNDSTHYTLVFDNIAPSLNITSPAENTTFYGQKNKQVTIEGSGEAGCTLTVNNRVIVLDDSGNFKFTMTLSDGENILNFKLTDRAGNQTEKDYKLNYSS